MTASVITLASAEGVAESHDANRLPTGNGASRTMLALPPRVIEYSSTVIGREVEMGG
jgi:hypothetical protein